MEHGAKIGATTRPVKRYSCNMVSLPLILESRIIDRSRSMFDLFLSKYHHSHQRVIRLINKRD